MSNVRAILASWSKKLVDDVDEFNKHLVLQWKNYNGITVTMMYCTGLITYFYGGNHTRLARRTDMDKWFVSNLHHKNGYHLWTNTGIILILGCWYELNHGAIFTALLIIFASIITTLSTTVYAYGASGTGFAFQGALLADFVSRAHHDENLFRMLMNFKLSLALGIGNLITLASNDAFSNVCVSCHVSGYVTGLAFMFAHGAVVMWKKKRVRRGLLNCSLGILCTGGLVTMATM